MRRIVIAGAACAMGIAMASGALAQERYGAIAYSQETDAHGWSLDFSTQGEAEKRALKECGIHGPGCVVTTWFRNACGALAVAPDRSWGADWGASEDEAGRKALGRCRTHAAKGCVVARAVCTE
ncbi:DUF4189 domain-containing protein [Salinarimonas sp.]|uniref:DUF4189 domain-containing protein n=1 Tax=Salinarimonas sp. TaxID=2766526 RepID=UPI0032D8EAD8